MTTPALAGLLAALAVGVNGGGDASTADRRLRRMLLTLDCDGPTGARPRHRRLNREAMASALAGGALVLLLPGPVGWFAGVVTAFAGPRVLPRLESSADRVERRRATDDAPIAVDLLAACLAAGSTPDASLLAVGAALDGRVGRSLSDVGRALALGSEPTAAWGALLDDPVLGRLARPMIRAERSGTPLVAVLVRVADDLRLGRRLSAEAAARRVGVLAVAPLGLCFLPAFLLLGVVPVVWSLAVAAFSPS